MENFMGYLRTLCLATLLSAGISGCFDSSKTDQGTAQNPDNGSSIQMKQH
jgi:hypothetical protein